MVPLSQPEDVKRLRYRWRRLIEVWVAYRVFLHREVHVGPDKVCLNEAIVAQTGHTLLILYYSYIYSLFDPRGVDFATVTKAIEPMLSPETLRVRDKILELWQRLRDPVERIRHNIGFHGAPGEKGHRQASGSSRSSTRSFRRCFVPISASSFGNSKPSTRAA